MNLKKKIEKFVSFPPADFRLQSSLSTNDSSQE